MPLFTPGAAEAARNPVVIYNAADGSGRTYGATIEAMPSTRPAAPSAPTVALSTTGGSIGAGVGVQYRVTSVDNGIESLVSGLSTLVTTSTSSSTNVATLTLSPVAGAEFYNIYGRTTGGQLYIMTVETSTTTVKTDTGAVTPSGAAPSSALTAGTVSLRIPSITGGTRAYQKNVVAEPATSIGEAGKYEYRRV